MYTEETCIQTFMVLCLDCMFTSHHWVWKFHIFGSLKWCPHRSLFNNNNTYLLCNVVADVKKNIDTKVYCGYSLSKKGSWIHYQLGYWLPLNNDTTVQNISKTSYWWGTTFVITRPYRALFWLLFWSYEDNEILSCPVCIILSLLICFDIL